MLREVKALASSASDCGREEHEDLRDCGFKPQLTDIFLACKCVDKD